MALLPARPIKSIATAPGLMPFVAAGMGEVQSDPHLAGRVLSCSAR